jgi:hypothetical protein
MAPFTPTMVANVDLPDSFTPLQKWAYAAMLVVKLNPQAKNAALQVEKVLGWDNQWLRDLTDAQCLWWLEWSKGALAVWGIAQVCQQDTADLSSSVDQVLMEATAFAAMIGW